MKRFLVSVGIGAIPCALAWLGGFDFDKRGAGAVWCFALTLMAFGASYFAPWWYEFED